MLTIPSVFSDNAVFQQNSEIMIPLETKPGSRVELKLFKKREKAGVFSSVADVGGLAKIIFQTPAASFDEYEIVISSSEESITLKNILFGEVYIASG